MRPKVQRFVSGKAMARWRCAGRALGAKGRSERPQRAAGASLAVGGAGRGTPRAGADGASEDVAQVAR